MARPASARSRPLGATSSSNPRRPTTLHRGTAAAQNVKGGKMYIQDKVEEYADEVFDLLNNGAHIYFCGEGRGQWLPRGGVLCGAQRCAGRVRALAGAARTRSARRRLRPWQSAWAAGRRVSAVCGSRASHPAACPPATAHPPAAPPPPP